VVSINVETLGPVSAWMGDRLWVGKLSRYVTDHAGQLSLAIPPREGEMSTSLGLDLLAAAEYPDPPSFCRRRKSAGKKLRPL